MDVMNCCYEKAGFMEFRPPGMAQTTKVNTALLCPSQGSFPLGNKRFGLLQNPLMYLLPQGVDGFRKVATLAEG
jgi:hypothetical protein